MQFPLRANARKTNTTEKPTLCESERESVCPSPKQAKKDPNLFQGSYVGPKARKEKTRIER
jgi:hypothetical protein